MDDTLRAIKAELRAAMNGIAAQSIRQSGMNYHVTFGVELPRLRQIAAEFTPDRRLALALWQENVRESKLLAIMLFPPQDFDQDMADLWVDDLVPQQAEVAQLLCMDILPCQPYAAEQAFLWMADERPMRQLCGFSLFTRLLMQGASLSPDAEAEFIDQAEATLPTTFLPLRKAVTNALLRLEQTHPQTAKTVQRILNA